MYFTGAKIAQKKDYPKKFQVDFQVDLRPETGDFYCLFIE